MKKGLYFSTILFLTWSMGCKTTEKNQYDSQAKDQPVSKYACDNRKEGAERMTFDITTVAETAEGILTIGDENFGMECIRIHGDQHSIDDIHRLWACKESGEANAGFQLEIRTGGLVTQTFADLFLINQNEEPKKVETLVCKY